MHAPINPCNLICNMQLNVMKRPGGSHEGAGRKKDSQSASQQARSPDGEKQAKKEGRSRKVTARMAQASKVEDSGKELKKNAFRRRCTSRTKRDRVQLVPKARESRIQKEQFFHFCA